jgi:anti-sigma factor ChrR (cupin superfamily)
MMQATMPLAIAAVRLHADHSQRCVLDSHALDWMPSPSPKVSRRLLERDGGEVARATSVVRYEPGARFDSHLHEFGEEIVVLEGVLHDEHGAYPAGTYLRNPPGSSHAPFSPEGCLLLVKLRHIDPLDTERVVVNLHEAPWRPGLVAGLSVLPLHSFETRHTAMVRWAPGTQFQPHRHFGGEEIFVLEGVFEDEHGRYPAGCWLRSPHLSQHQPFSREGCLIFVKTGHLLPV